MAALEFASGVEATVVGKPSAAFFTGAARALGVSLADIVVEGDDLTTDVQRPPRLLPMDRNDEAR